MRTLIFIGALATTVFTTALTPPIAAESNTTDNVLSPVWPARIRQWQPEIARWSREHALDPDLIAAIIEAESNGIPTATSYVGAVGLMGIMPQGPGFEFRPTSEALTDPNINISWGTAILADILRQSGGDLQAALAAYNGGWRYATYAIPRDYAHDVLHLYGRAIAVRNGHDPDTAHRWTIAQTFERGHLPPAAPTASRLHVPARAVPAERLVYAHSDPNGRSYYVEGIALPVELAPRTLELNDALFERLEP